ncbi:MAG TPA: transposase [Roseomonas sp.]
MSARTEFVEVVTRGERRRRWSAEQKLRIVAEAMQPGVVAKEGRAAGGDRDGPALHVAARSPRGDRARIGCAATASGGSGGAFCRAAGCRGPERTGRTCTDIQARRDRDHAPERCRRAVDAAVDGAALRRVLAALEGR